jgi:hypothetical protein
MIVVTGIIDGNGFRYIWRGHGCLLDDLAAYLDTTLDIGRGGTDIVRDIERPTVAAFGDYYVLVTRVVQGIPHHSLGVSGRWFGDHAKFIIANLER